MWGRTFEVLRFLKKQPGATFDAILAELWPDQDTTALRAPCARTLDGLRRGGLICEAIDGCSLRYGLLERGEAALRVPPTARYAKDALICKTPGCGRGVQILKTQQCKRCYTSAKQRQYRRTAAAARRALHGRNT